MQFLVKAFREADGVVMLRYDAASQQDAILKAEMDGFKVIKADAKNTFSLRLPTSDFPIGLFTQELLALLEAGLQLLPAIDALAKKEKRPEVVRVYEALVKMLREGKPFSAALEHFPTVFPPLYIALVSASERTGNLTQAFKRFIDYKQDMDALKSKVISALIYPSLLIVVGGLVIGFLMTYVVPRFSQVYEDIGNDLPLMSQLLMEWGQLFRTNEVALTSMLVIFFILLLYWITRQGTKQTITRLAVNVPALEDRMRLYQLSRFYRTLGMLLEGGIHIRMALEMTTSLLSLQALNEGLIAAKREINEGKSVSDAMQRNGLATDVAYRMLSVGEQSGNLGDMMERIARFHDAETARWMEWFSKLFEPLLMVFIGLIIGGIVLLMYMPIFELAGSIQ